MLLPMISLAAAAAVQPPPAPGCINVRGEGAVVLEGRLERHVYPGPPNYESIRRGDRAEPTYILTLDRPICIDDGGEFADPSRHFDAVHIFDSGEDNRLPRQMRAAVGHRIRISGTGFASFNAHHHAPLVVRVTQLGMVRR